MGNIDSRSTMEGGYIYVKTSQPYYEPGNTVAGTIHIRVNPGCTVNATALHFKVHGYEYVSYNYMKRGHDGKKRRKRMVIHNTFVDFDMKCCDLAGTLAEGDYSFPF